MVEEGRAQYADPSSMIKAVAMLMNHIGMVEKARRLEMALEVCTQYERAKVITGRSNGATGEEFARYVLDTVNDPRLEDRWNGYQAER
jgi:isocitrate dehydrogenase (NAD+)